MTVNIKISRYNAKLDIADLTFIVFFSSTVISVVLSKVFGFMHISRFATPFFLWGLTFLFVLCLIKYSLKRWLNSVVLYFGIVLLFLVSYIITPELAEWYSNSSWGLAYRVFRIDRGLYAFFAILLVREPKKILRNLKIVGFIWTPYLIWQAVQRIQLGYFIVTENDGITTSKSLYTLSYGYNAVFIGLIFFMIYKKNKNKIYLALGWMLCCLAITFGSRGSLIVLGCYFLIWELLKLRTDLSKQRIIRTFLLICLVVIVVPFYDYIIAALGSVLESIGIQSRTLQSLLSSAISDTNGREKIWGAAIEQINRYFPLGAGAFGDRLSAGKVLAWGYCHSIILEMLASFGLVGAIVLCVMVNKSIKIIVSDMDYELVNLFVLFFSCSIKLLISDSFWYNAHFWGALALAYLYKMRTKELQQQECSENA